MPGNESYACTLNETDLRKAAEELNENPIERMSQVETLRQWVRSQPHLTCRTDDHFLLRFLRNAKFSQLKAQEKLDNFVTVRCSPTQGVPDWFSGLDPLDPNVSKLLETPVALPLPGTDDQGRKVVLIRTGDYDPKTVDYGDVMRVSFINGDILLLEESFQVNGALVVLDFGQLCTAHMTNFSRELLGKCMKCWNDVYPSRTKSINYINTGSIFNAVFEISKYFMKEKTKKRLHFHKDSLESLHQQVPKRLLPTEYGGDAGPMKELAKSWKEHVIKNMAELELNTQSFGIDESKRTKKEEPQQSGSWGLVGSFRKLVVD